LNSLHQISKAFVADPILLRLSHATKNKAKLGKATAGEKSLRANTKLQKLQSKSTNVSPPEEEEKLPRSFANCRSYAGSNYHNRPSQKMLRHAFLPGYDIIKVKLQYQGPMDSQA